MVSDDLGSQAVRRFYETTGSTFDAMQVAKDAFYAGNDLLYLNKFVSSTDPDTYTTIIRTLQFFTQKYRTDPEFTRRVDASLERILTLKFRLYPEFELQQVQPGAQSVTEVGKSEAAQQISFEIARQAVTLISPDASELVNVLPQPPQSRDRIVFLTDVQPGSQCTGCQEQVSLPADALQSAVLRLYGSRTAGQVSHSLMSSYSYLDLWKVINSYSEVPNLEDDLKLADWVVISMLKPNPNLPESQAFRRLLSERPDLLRNKKVIVFAFDSPYYLDATDISKLTAYYGLYSKTPAFIDVAARILFQELQPAGSLPVSVPGVGYDLIQATSPDPSQVIPLYIDAPGDPLFSKTPSPTAAVAFRVDDVITLRTGIIYDHNNHPVPDDTPVTFTIGIVTDSGTFTKSLASGTVDGVAHVSYRIDRANLLEIQVNSDQGAKSNILRLDIGGAGGVTVIFAPTQAPSQTPEPTETPTPTITPTVVEVPPLPPTVHFQDWFLVVILILGVSAGVSWYGIRQEITRWGLRWALCGIIGGLLAYNYLALGFPGSDALLRDSGTGGVLMVTFVGVAVGWAIGLLWKQFSPPSNSSADKNPTGERSTTGGRRAAGPRS